MKLFVGIDVAKDKFDAALLLANGKWRAKVFANRAKGFAELLRWLPHHGGDATFHLLLEATGPYGEALALALFDAGHTVSVINAFVIKKFGEATFNRAKTDQIDAQLIARYGQVLTPKPWTPPPASIRVLQALVRRLEALNDLHQQEFNRLEMAHASVQPSIEHILGTLEREIKALKQQIHDHIDQDPDLRSRRELLNTIPGIGPASIALLLSFLPDLQRMQHGKQLVAFAGTNPRIKESGKYKGYAKIQRAGHAALRAGLYMPTVVAIQHNPHIRRFFERLTQRGKPGKVAVIAALNKLLRLVFAVLKNNRPYDPGLGLAKG